MGCSDSKPAPAKRSTPRPGGTSPPTKPTSKPNTMPQQQQQQATSPDNTSSPVEDQVLKSPRVLRSPRLGDTARKGSGLQSMAKERVNRREYPQDEKRRSTMGVPRTGSVRKSQVSPDAEAGIDAAINALYGVDVSAPPEDAKSESVDSEADNTDPDLLWRSFRLIDKERYTRAQKSFSDYMKKCTPASMDTVVCIFGMSVLHNLGDHYSAPQVIDSSLTHEINDAKVYLEKLAEDKQSPGAMLALAEFYRASQNHALEMMFRTKAADTKHPLGKLRYGVASLSDLKEALQNEAITEDEYAQCKTIIIQDLAKMAEDDTCVGSKAAKVIWPSYYKGSDGMPRDLLKAKETLEKAIEGEHETATILKLKTNLSKVIHKLSNEEEDNPSFLGTLKRGSSFHSFVRHTSQEGEAVTMARSPSALKPARYSVGDPLSRTHGAATSRSPSAASPSLRRNNSVRSMRESQSNLTSHNLQVHQDRSRSPDSLSPGSQSPALQMRSRSFAGSVNDGRLSPARSEGGRVETVVEVEVGGHTFGCLKNDEEPRSARGNMRDKLRDLERSFEEDARSDGGRSAGYTNRSFRDRRQSANPVSQRGQAISESLRNRDDDNASQTSFRSFGYTARRRSRSPMG
eukprot:Rhum_TRINITY_DN13275_c3_g1::Rhum_TRINITY_DN13275_c3_g1_i1::g.58806::m.58806